MTSASRDQRPRDSQSEFVCVYVRTVEAEQRYLRRSHNSCLLIMENDVSHEYETMVLVEQ